MYIIQNDYLKVVINEKGATLWSIEDQHGHEYLWQGNPQYWGNRGPHLFPYIGRLSEGKYTFDGEEYEMNIHGFARNMVFKAVQISQKFVIFSIRDTKETYKQYPIHFSFSIMYKLDKNRINITYYVKNEDEKEMYFGVGGHPGFYVPMDQNTQFEDWYLDFEVQQRVKQVEMSENALTTENLHDYPLEEGVRIPLKHNLFDQDAIVLTNVPSSVLLKSDKSHRAIKVTYPQMPYVGFWHTPKTEAPFVCIEPWSSLPSREGVVEDLATQPSLLSLKGHHDYINKWSVEIIYN